MNRIRRLKGSLMLLLAAFFWGTTFAAQSTAADSIPLFTFNAARSFVGAAFLGILILIRQGSRKGKAGSDSGVGQKRGAVSGGKRQFPVCFSGIFLQIPDMRKRCGRYGSFRKPDVI